MPAINLRIVREGDPPPWPDLAPGSRPFDHLGGDTTWGVAVLERGMASGEPSIALRLELPGGRTVVAETSLDAWIAATSGMRGAFPAAFAGGPLAAPPGNGRGLAAQVTGFRPAAAPRRARR